MIESAAQAEKFITRAWDAALKDATELGLAQQTEEASLRLQERKASLILALQNMSNSGFQNAEQASGILQRIQHVCSVTAGCLGSLLRQAGCSEDLGFMTSLCRLLDPECHGYPETDIKSLQEVSSNGSISPAASAASAASATACTSSAWSFHA